HVHYTEYAPPVLRPPSPASSVGTTYGPDQTSFSDSEYRLSQPAFEQKWEEKIQLNMPRKEELDADQDPLLTIPRAAGPAVPIAERKIVLHDRVMLSLRAAVAQLEENELFEQALLRGSQAGLETQPSTNDVDVLLRSMMGPGLNINAGPHMGMSTAPHRGPRPPTAGSGMTNGPWNNFGKATGVDRRESVVASGDNMLSETTVGKRSRNGSSR
ncbi:hypothetical protein B0H34DRAFT_629318, partial [Crassisporium funariophilum]